MHKNQPWNRASKCRICTSYTTTSNFSSVLLRSIFKNLLFCDWVLCCWIDVDNTINTKPEDIGVYINLVKTRGHRSFWKEKIFKVFNLLRTLKFKHNFHFNIIYQVQKYFDVEQQWYCAYINLVKTRVIDHSGRKKFKVFNLLRKSSTVVKYIGFLNPIYSRAFSARPVRTYLNSGRTKSARIYRF